MVLTAKTGRRLPRFVAAILCCNLLVSCTGGSTNSPSPASADSTTIVNVDTGNTATDTTVSLQWLANRDAVAGYIVYYGPSPQNAVTTAVQLAVSVSVNASVYVPGRFFTLV